MEQKNKLAGALIGLAGATEGAARLYDSTWQNLVGGLCVLSSCEDAGPVFYEEILAAHR